MEHIILPADDCTLNFRRLGELACFHCMLCCLDSGSLGRIQVSSPVTLHCKNKFRFNCMSFKFLLDASHRQSFIFWSSIGETHRAHSFVINKCSCKIALMEPILVSAVSAINCTLIWRFFSTVFSTARQFLQTDVPTGAYLQGSFSLDETQLLSDWQWHMMAHIHCKQQPFCCVPAVAECSSVSKILWMHDSRFH